MFYIESIKQRARRIFQWIWPSTAVEHNKKDDDIELCDLEANESLLPQQTNQVEEEASVLAVASGLGNIIFAKENHQRIAVAMSLYVLNTGSNFLTYYILGELLKKLNEESKTSLSATALISLLVLSYSLSQITPALRDQVMNKVTAHNVGKALEMIVDHLLHKSLSHHVSIPESTHINLIQKGFSIPGVGIPLLTQLGPTVLEIISACIILSNFCGLEVSASLVGFISIFILYSVYTVKPIVDAREEHATSCNKVWSECTGAIPKYKNIHDYNQLDYVMTKVKLSLSDFIQSDIKAKQLQARLNIGHIVLARLYMLGVTLYIAQQIKAERYPVESFIVLVGYLNQLAMLLPAFGESLNSVCAEYPNCRFVFSELAKGHEIVDAPSAEALRINADHASIEFKQVSFTYPVQPGASRGNLFNNLSFTVGSGQTIALVSKSGGGKTSILNLLYRYYRPAHGAIMINGQDISTVTWKSLKHHIAIFGQTPNLFQGTVRENILCGASNPDDVTNEMLMTLAQKANLLELIIQLGQKHATNVDVKPVQSTHGFFTNQASVIDQFMAGLEVDVGEKGQKLSGGEQQKVAVLRGMLKEGHIRLLDEVTASCDAESAAQILQALRQTAEGKTTIMVTHKLIEAKDADQILVLSEGRVIARGTHKELLESDALYQQLWHENIRGADSFVEQSALNLAPY